MLHLTDGDCAAQALILGGIAPHDIVPWRDVLHEGPVPAGLPLEQLSDVRARFLAESGSGDYEGIRALFYERDVRLAGSQAEDEVVCWFESDLYDQLQLLQLLDWYAEHSHRPIRLSLIQLDLTPEGGFEALGALAPPRVHALQAQRQTVTEAQLGVARLAWAAFRAPSPLQLERLWRAGELAVLPCLPEAVQRLLEDLPWVGTGLSRSAYTALECLAPKPMSAGALFRAVQTREHRPFLGDTWFWRVLRSMEAGPQPLVAREGPVVAERGVDQGLLRLTSLGQALVDGRHTWSGSLERWWGGTRMTPRGSVWHWDGAHRRVVAG
ncbi:MAG: hypothetical protein IT532_06020 [Burkholderiales bacterium]|nr:hypothetical protein [Burkholderiales bacterium]